MAQRTLDSSFWDDEDVAALSFGERLLLICMFTDVSLSDDFGCLPANPKTLRKHAFGYDDDVTTDQVSKWRNNILSKCSNVVLYQVDGQEYIFLKKFEQWQQLRYHRKSNTPKPTGQAFPPDDEPQPEPEPAQETVSSLQKIAETSQNVSDNSAKFPLCSVVLNRVELNREEMGSVPTAQALPAASTPPTAPNISLSQDRKYLQPPIMPVEPNKGLSQPEIFELKEAAVKAWAEIRAPVKPDAIERSRLEHNGRNYGYRQLVETLVSSKDNIRLLSDVTTILRSQFESTLAVSA
jgi:hypothetical protein